MNHNKIIIIIIIIGCENQFVEVVYNADTSTITCKFFSNADYSCSIKYGLCLDNNIIETKSNTIRSNTTGSNQVLLQIQSGGSAQLCYVVTARNDTFAVLVKGKFNVASGIYVIQYRITLHHI